MKETVEKPKINTGDLLRALEDGHLLTPDEACHLLTLTHPDHRRHLREIVKPPTPETGFTPQASLFLTNLCELAPAIYSYPQPDDSKSAFILTVDDIDEQLEKAHIRNIRQLYLSAGFWSPLRIPGLEAPTLLKTLTRLLSHITEHYEGMMLWGFSPDEIDFLSIVSDRSHRYLLERFMDHGLRCLSGRRAEILDDAVRRKISPKKTSVKTWLSIMKTACQLSLPISASMTYGHFEKPIDQARHLDRLRQFAQTHQVQYALTEIWPLPQQHAQAERLGFKPLTLQERQNLQAVARLMLGSVSPLQQAQWFVNDANTQSTVDEALEHLEWGADYLGTTDALAYPTYMAGISRGNMDVSLSAGEMSQWLTDAGHAPQLQADTFMRK